MENSDGIVDIIDIMGSEIIPINPNAGFNINKRVHPSYLKPVKTLIPSLKPISLTPSKTSVPIPFPKKNEIPLPSSPKQAPLPSSPKQVPLPSSPKQVPLPSSPKQVPLPSSPKGLILPSSPKGLVLPSSPKGLVLPSSPKGLVLPSPRGPVLPSPRGPVLPSSPKGLVLPSPKSPILPSPKGLVLPSPKSPVLPSPKQIILPSSPNTVYVTNLKPTINPKGKIINNQNNEIQLPILSTIINPDQSRPEISPMNEINISTTLDLDDQYRKILTNPAIVDFKRLNHQRSGPKNKNYDLPEVKEIAKMIGVSTDGNKDPIIDKILNKALSLGIDIKK